ncbi:MAG: RIO1 family regulatory kinase/ATPase [Phycisphaeraceae bacterium]
MACSLPRCRRLIPLPLVRLPEAPAAPGDAQACYKRQPKSGVWRVRRPGEAAKTCKRWPLSWLMLLKLILGHAPVQRTRRGTRRLRRAGLSTPAVLGPWRIRAGGGSPVVEQMLEHVEGQPLCEILRAPEADARTARELARRVGRLAAELAQRRLVHTDFKVSNIILSGDRLWIIDTADVVRRFRPGSAAGLMLDRLAALPEEWHLGIPPRIYLPALLAALRPLPRKQRRQALAWLRRAKERQSKGAVS